MSIRLFRKVLCSLNLYYDVVCRGRCKDTTLACTDDLTTRFFLLFGWNFYNYRSMCEVILVFLTGSENFLFISAFCNLIRKGGSFCSCLCCIISSSISGCSQTDSHSAMSFLTKLESMPSVKKCCS